MYRKHGVREYLVWRTMEAGFDCMVLQDGRYQKIDLPLDGIVRSAVLPGLWLNTSAALHEDWAAALHTMQSGIASPEHALFVEQLKQKAMAIKA